MNTCICGCGKSTNYLYEQGHNNKGTKRTHRTGNNLCQCGCGKYCVNRYVNGHKPSWNKGIYSGIYCKCGCGKKTRSSIGFFRGHPIKKPRYCACGCGKKSYKSDCIRGHKIKGTLCLCGCGQKCRRRCGYKKEHDKVNLCLCGCGQLCKNKYVHNHFSIGKKFTEEHKKRMGESQKRNKNRKHWAKGLTKYTDERIRKYAENKERNIKISNIMKGRKRSDIAVENALKNNFYRKRFPYISDIGIGVKMRSNWEVKYAKYLDSQRIIWEYEPRGFKLSNGRRYWPDFYLPILDEWHEVKGYMYKKDIEKIRLFREEYNLLKYEIIGKQEMTSLNLI